MTQGFDTTSVGQRMVKYTVTLNGKTYSYQLRYNVISEDALAYDVAQITSYGADWFLGSDYELGNGYYKINVDRYALERYKAVELEGMTDEEFENRNPLLIYSYPRVADEKGKVAYDHSKSGIAGYIKVSELEPGRIEAYKDTNNIYHIYSFSFEYDEDAQRELDELMAEHQGDEGGEEEGFEEE